MSHPAYRTILALAVLLAAPALSYADDTQSRKPGQEAPLPKQPSDKAPADAPNEPTGWSGTQTNPAPKDDPPSAKPPLEGTGSREQGDNPLNKKK